MKNEQFAHDLYAELIGAAAAKRNGQRIEKLVALIDRYGRNVRLVEVEFGDLREKMDLIHRYQEFVLGSTTRNSRGAGSLVFAEVDGDSQHDGVQATHHA